jgi:hypothetical protein
MPLGIVNDDIFEAELTHSKVNEPLAIVVEKKGPGRPQETENVPDSIRKIIGDTALESGNAEAKKIARFFGTSEGTISAYKKGATSMGDYNNPAKELGKHINKTKERIAKRASNRINLAFDAFTKDKLEEATAPELASVIKQLSGVVKDMEPVREAEERGPAVQFVIHAPQIAREDTFDVIAVNE